MVQIIAFAVFVSMATTTVPLRAECIVSTVSNQKRRAVRVFEATVTSINALEHREFVAMLNVHRVWKGNTRSEATVYFISSIDGPSVESGKRYIFFAEPLNPAARKAYGLPADHPQRSNWVPPCGGAIPAADNVVEQLGRSRKPE